MFLPTLEEMHAVVVGRGLHLKQPVIIRLNDKNIATEPDPPSMHLAETNHNT